MEVFQSAPLTRGETIGGRSLAVLAGISIHSPHTRGDKYHQGKPVHARFQSTPLMRGETVGGQIQVEPVLFQSTPLIRGETGFVIKANAKDQFQSTPLMRGETRKTKK